MFAMKRERKVPDIGLSLTVVLGLLMLATVAVGISCSSTTVASNNTARSQNDDHQVSISTESIHHHHEANQDGENQLRRGNLQNWVPKQEGNHYAPISLSTYFSTVPSTMSLLQQLLRGGSSSTIINTNANSNTNTRSKLADVTFADASRRALAVADPEDPTKAEDVCNTWWHDPSRMPKGIPPVGTKFCDGYEWMMVLSVAGMMYMFLALSLVCDELFIPALEVLSDSMGISSDVAGATLMAAGGSAPEFFTSLISALQTPPTSTGFGTIVGSATFNVLLVISVCGLSSKETLSLTWWPLARDCIYYSVSLSVLAISFGCGVPGKNFTCDPNNSAIAWYEALVLFAMYFGYVLVVRFSTTLQHGYLAARRNGKEGIKKWMREVRRVNTLFNQPHEFRGSILSILMQDEGLARTCGVKAVAKIKGDIQETFDEIDTNGDQHLDRAEIKTMLSRFGMAASDEDVDIIFTEVDVNNDGEISKEEFSKWYEKSEEYLYGRIKEEFDNVDTDEDGKIDGKELKQVLKRLVRRDVGDSEVERALSEMNHADGGVSFNEFREWYKKSMFWAQAQELQKLELEASEPFSLWPLPKNWRGRFVYALTIPIIFPLFLTVPDVRRQHLRTFKWAIIAFFMAIVWIALFSWYMVFCAETFGAQVGIPNVVMGYTFLAAGTSIPDLLSSVIVARQGFGDMAVSSSIGSNIFDILVGLPVPWLIAIAFLNSESDDGPILGIKVEADGLVVSILVLLFMVLFLVISIMYSGWKLSKRLSWVFMALYGVFLIQAVLTSVL